MKKTVKHKTAAEIIKKAFEARKAKNPSYSTRAFARDLQISQTLLSLIMNGKRNLTLNQAMHIGAMLGFTRQQAEKLIQATLLSQPKKDKKGIVKLEENLERSGHQMWVPPEFRPLWNEGPELLRKWFFVPLLELIMIKDFREAPEWIAARLGITAVEAVEGIDLLLKLKLIERKGKKLVRTHTQVDIPWQGNEGPLSAFQEYMIELAKLRNRIMEKEERKLQEISSMTIAVSKSKIEFARKKAKEFLREMSIILEEDEDLEELYQLNVQFFPLTREIKDRSPGDE